MAGEVRKLEGGELEVPLGYEQIVFGDVKKDDYVQVHFTRHGSQITYKGIVIQVIERLKRKRGIVRMIAIEGYGEVYGNENPVVFRKK